MSEIRRRSFEPKEKNETNSNILKQILSEIMHICIKTVIKIMLKYLKREAAFVINFYAKMNNYELHIGNEIPEERRYMRNTLLNLHPQCVLCRHNAGSFLDWCT